MSQRASENIWFENWEKIGKCWTGWFKFQYILDYELFAEILSGIMRNHQWSVYRDIILDYELFAGSRRSACAVTARPSVLTMEGGVNISYFLTHIYDGEGRGGWFKIDGIKRDNNSGPRLMATLLPETKCYRVRSSFFCCWQKHNRKSKWYLKWSSIFLSRWDGGDVEEVVRGPGLRHNKLVSAGLAYMHICSVAKKGSLFRDPGPYRDLFDFLGPCLKAWGSL